MIRDKFGTIYPNYDLVDGKIISHKTGEPLKEQTTTDGYKQVMLFANGKRRAVQIGEIELAMVKLPPFPRDYIVSYIDGKPRWQTRSLACKNNGGHGVKARPVRVEFENGSVEEYKSVTDCAYEFIQAPKTIQAYMNGQTKRPLFFIQYAIERIVYIDD